MAPPETGRGRDAVVPAGLDTAGADVWSLALDTSAGMRWQCSRKALPLVRERELGVAASVSRPDALPERPGGGP